MFKIEKNVSVRENWRIDPLAEVVAQMVDGDSVFVPEGATTLKGKVYDRDYLTTRVRAYVQGRGLRVLTREESGGFRFWVLAIK